MKYQVFIFFLISNMKIKFITSKFLKFQQVVQRKMSTSVNLLAARTTVSYLAYS